MGPANRKDDHIPQDKSQISIGATQAQTAFASYLTASSSS